MTTNGSPSLPPECRIRSANFKDVWQLLKLPFAFHTRNNSFQLGIISNKFFSIINIFSLLLFTSSISYFLSNKISEILFSNVINRLPLPDNLLTKLTLLLYGQPTSYGYNVSENPNLLGNILSVILTLILLLPLFLIFIRHIYLNTWVVECDRHIIATASILRRRQYSVLRSLYVVPAYRQQAIGSSLVKSIIQQVQQPVHLVCRPQLVTFYTRLGFIQTQQPWRRSIGLIYMVTINTSTSSTQRAATVSNPSIHECVIHKAQAGDIWKIRKFLFFSPTQDFFLPFGINFSLILSLIILTWLCLPVIILILINLRIALLIDLLSWFLLILLLVSIIIPLLITFWGTQNYSQFWLLEYRSKLIGYARLSSDGYSIFRHLYITVGLEQGLDTNLIRHTIGSANKPIYVSCSAEAAKLFTDIGFSPIAIQNLPKKLRFGARFNLQMGGVNLVYLFNE